MRGGLFALGRFSSQKQFWLLHRFCWKPPCLNYWPKSNFSVPFFQSQMVSSKWNYRLPASLFHWNYLATLQPTIYFSHFPQSASGARNRTILSISIMGEPWSSSTEKTGDIPWKSDPCLKEWEGAEIEQWFGQGWRMHLFTVELIQVVTPGVCFSLVRQKSTRS